MAVSFDNRASDAPDNVGRSEILSADDNARAVAVASTRKPTGRPEPLQLARCHGHPFSSSVTPVFVGQQTANTTDFIRPGVRWVPLPAGYAVVQDYWIINPLKGLQEIAPDIALIISIVRPERALDVFSVAGSAGARKAIGQPEEGHGISPSFGIIAVSPSAC
jgi:hypothetical protein